MAGSLILAAAPSAAECLAYFLDAWPHAQAPLPTNGQIVVEGHGQLQDLVMGIARHSPTLVSKSDRVRLDVSAVHRGQFHVAQAVLVPARELRPDTTYTLELQGLDEERQAMWTQGRGWKQPPLRWRTAARPDRRPPRWSSPPTVRKAEVIPYGCGPEVMVHLKVDVLDDSAVALRVALRPKDRPWPAPLRFGQQSVSTPAAPPGESATYIVRIDGGVARVGHGMCSGPFALDSGRFTASFTAIDAAGNESPAPAGDLEFSGPDWVSDLTSR